jgi:hypothetical protein
MGVFMKILATTVTHVDDIRFTDLKGIERRCSYCMQYFNPGDAIAVLSKTFYGEDEVPMSNDDTFLLHIVKPNHKGSSCLGEFSADLYMEVVPEETLPETPSKEMVLSGEVVNNPA